MVRALGIVGLVVAVAACVVVGGEAATADQLTRRASFDLGCAASELRYTRIDRLTQGAAGCGRRATYVETCQRNRYDYPERCTWILNGAVESAEPSPSTTSASDLSGPPGSSEPR